MQASPMPFIAPTNCQKTSGLYGLPKLRQLVIATGSPPAQVILRAASATAMAVPFCGSAYTYRELQSVVITMALSVSFTATTAASLGRLVVMVEVPIIESY